MPNSYIKVPHTISYKSIVEKDYTLSSSQYMDLIMPNKNTMLVKEFLSRGLHRKDLGEEVGSLNYIGQSTHFFIRTKALQSHSFLPEINKETALPIMPNTFVQMNLKEGDLLISKDSNIGEIAILDKDYPNHMLSGAIYKLPIEKYKYYLLAFIKHNIFREQLDFMVPKGATIRHAKTLFLDCQIPMPNHNVEKTIRFIEILTQAIVNKEKLIKQCHQAILETIKKELFENQNTNKLIYSYPRLTDLVNHNRLDATFHSLKHHALISPTLNYKFGFKSLNMQGLELKPGPSLEIKLLETRIDSDTYIKGFYRLITPKQIQNYGTVKKQEYIGTAKKIPPIQYGDILFGESGTGRSMVFLDKCINTINNAHAHILRPILNSCSLEKAITIRCIIQYYKEMGIIDCLTVGGSGGHLSPSYFDRVFIPNFPLPKQEEIAVMYHNVKIEYQSDTFTLDNFLEKDCEYNEQAGIYELDKTAKKLKEMLDNAIDDIINDREITINFEIKEEFR
jgi:hypothetical protein